MLRKIVSIFLVFVFTIFLMGYIIPVANADYFPSPTVSEKDLRVRYLPNIATNLYRVCDSDGRFVKFINFKDVSIELMDDLTDIQSNDKFVFKITIDTELNDGEYVELVILDYEILNVFLNDKSIAVDKYEQFNVIHINESGVIRIQ